MATILVSADRVVDAPADPPVSDAGREPEPGRVLTKSDTGSSLVTTTTVTPQGGVSLVQISTTREGAGGVGGFFERLFAPRVMRGIYAGELERPGAYTREHLAS